MGFPFQETQWGDKGKEGDPKSKPCHRCRAKAMHNIEAKKGTLSSGPSLCRGREPGRQAGAAAWELLHANQNTM